MTSQVKNLMDILGMGEKPKKKTSLSSPITNIIDIVRNKIEVLGGRFHKYDGFEICFDIPKDSDANNVEFLRRQRDVLAKYSITLKTRII